MGKVLKDLEEEILGQRGHIMIVDDEPAVCAAMRELLELKGYNVIEANNGVEGLRLCAQNPVDLIVLDLNMPRMDGYLFMEKLQDRWKLDRPPAPFPKILVLTAVNKKTDLGLAKNLGASEFMTKPFKSKEFTDAIHKLLGH